MPGFIFFGLADIQQGHFLFGQQHIQVFDADDAIAFGKIAAVFLQTGEDNVLLCEDWRDKQRQQQNDE